MPPPTQGLKQIFASLPVFRNVGSKAQQWAGEEEFVDLQVGRTCWAGVQRKMRTELWCAAGPPQLLSYDGYMMSAGAVAGAAAANIG